MESSLKKLEEIMAILRSEKGCPWDREQDLQNLKSFLLEEAYEVIEALDKGDTEKLKEELGDLLFQIIFIAQIGKEKKIFSLDEIIDFCYEKMIRRHPHVFGNKEINSSTEVLNQWEMIKRKEKSANRENFFQENYDSTLPALMKAYRITTRASRVGFDWQEIKQVIEKLKEELSELQEAITKGNREQMEHEVGDVLFAAANVSRFLGINPELALQKINHTFLSRFNYIEEKLKERGKSLKESNLAEMDALWEKAKKDEKSGDNSNISNLDLEG